MEIFNRSLYYNQILPFIGKNLIKVITGQRRVGKSFFLRQILEKIKQENKQTQIIYINKEDFAFDSVENYADLINYVENKDSAAKNTVLFIDEIQEIENFEKALRHFHSKETFDIYCTGSNAKLLSGELATLLSGRSIEIEVFSLTYPEFLQFHRLNDNEESFDRYLFFGGMPNLIHFNLTEDIVYDYLKNLYNTIIVKDVITRHSIRNVSFLRNLSLYIAENTGSVISAKSISDYLKSQQIKMSPALVQDYLSYLSEAYFIHKVNRSDIQGKKIFEIGEKYFFNDIGMRNALIGYKATDISKILENIVFLHLKAAGYQITVGKDRTKEIDFVARKNSELLYVQVCYMLKEQSTIDREFGNLQKIKNNYSKIVVSMDKTSKATYAGIKHIHIKDFCLNFVELIAF
ncbi:MAG: ATP-binding protein [Bacteroidales bacterium]|nr:ATP-binding protein [Bacteroidales bacterium]